MTAATPRADQPPPPRPEKRVPKPTKSNTPDSAAIGAGNGSTTLKEREERHSAATTESRAAAIRRVLPPDTGGWKTEALRALDSLVAEIERLRDRAVCSGCGNDVGESGACSYPGCDDGEMIPASELPLALREMRDRRDEVEAGGDVPVSAEHPAATTLPESEEDVRQALTDIAHLVRYEWRLRDHNIGLVLRTIEQVLDQYGIEVAS